MTKSSMTPIFIIHGWTTQPDTWQPLQDELSKSGLTTTMLEVPGFGTSLKQAWDLSDYVEWLRKKISAAKQPVTLIVHSNGGRIALNLAQAHPEMIDKLVLLDAAGLPRKELKLQVKKTVFKVVAKLGKKVTKNPSARRLLYKLVREQDYYQASPVMRETMANLLASDNEFVTSKVIPVNSLIIWGSEDQATPLKDAYVLNHILQPSSLRIVEGAKHSPHRTHTKEVAREIAEFLNEDRV